MMAFVMLVETECLIHTVQIYNIRLVVFYADIDILNVTFSQPEFTIEGACKQ